MDLTILVGILAKYLPVALPFLLKAGGEAAAEEGGKQVAGAAWGTLKKVWTRLRGKVEERPAALEAAQDAAEAPEDPDAQAALRVQLKKILTADPELAAELEPLAEELRAAAPSYHAEVHGSGAVAQGPGAMAGGAGSIVVGGNVGGSATVHAKRQQHPKPDPE